MVEYGVSGNRVQFTRELMKLKSSPLAECTPVKLFLGRKIPSSIEALDNEIGIDPMNRFSVRTSCLR